MNDLATLIQAFRKRFRLSKAKAAAELEVSYQYMRSLDAGYDVATKLPFRVREPMLRHLADKMTAFGYPVTLDEIKNAAWGQPVGEEEPGPKVVPWTEIERAVIDEASELKIATGHLEDPEVIASVPSERAWVFEMLREQIKVSRKILERQKREKQRRQLDALPEKFRDAEPYGDLAAGQPRPIEEPWFDD